MRIIDDPSIPEWLKDSFPTVCPYCNSYLDVTHSPDGKRVVRPYCPNQECPGTISRKMVFMWDVLRVTGIKEGNSLKLVKLYDLKSHIEAIPHVLKEKPIMAVHDFMRICCIQGVDTSWEELCAGTSSFEELFQKPRVRKILSPSDIELVKKYSDYVDVRFPGKNKYEPVVSLLVMMTGDILGIEPREMFIKALNMKYKGLLDLRYSKSVRKTGVDYLIMENTSSSTNKSSVAKERGIPIVTPTEFVVLVDKLIRERVGNNGIES